TYVFLERHDGESAGHIARFDREYIGGELMETDIVREIFYIRDRQELPFRFLLKLKCTSAEADNFVHEMRVEAERKYSVSVNTRTVDTSYPLVMSSLSGVTESTRPKYFQDFIEAMGGQNLPEIDLARQMKYGPQADLDVLMDISAAWGRAKSI